MELDIQHTRRRRQPTRHVKSKKSCTGNNTPFHPLFLDRLTRMFDCAREQRTMDLGPAAPGTIRILIDYPVLQTKSYDWLHASIHSHDRTFTEWIKFIAAYKSCTLSNDDHVAAPPFHPFLHRRQAGVFLEKLFAENMRVRMLIQKFIARIRIRLMNKRHIGETDLYTTLPIPDSARVTVYDTKTRSKYSFHTHTAIQCMTNNLTYSSYGISNPIEPKNPYTNLTWHMGQTMTLIEQISTNFLRAHRFLPELLFSYRINKYNVVEFYKKNLERLQIGAAVNFFKNIHDPDVISVYDELIEDLHATVREPIVRPHAWAGIKRAIYNRQMPKELYTRWDQLIVSEWIWNNHGFFYNPFNTTADTEFRTLCALCIEWWRNAPRLVIRRNH